MDHPGAEGRAARDHASRRVGQQVPVRGSVVLRWRGGRRRCPSAAENPRLPGIALLPNSSAEAGHQHRLEAATHATVWPGASDFT